MGLGLERTVKACHGGGHEWDHEQEVERNEVWDAIPWLGVLRQNVCQDGVGALVTHMGEKCELKT